MSSKNQHDFGVEALPRYLDKVDERTKQLTPEAIGGVARLLQAHGKRLRPSLVIAVAYHSGRQIDAQVIDVAAAVELVHISSLVHDDIMDDGLLRWGVPTIHTKEGTDTAILAGDYLLAKACALAAGVSGQAATVVAEAIAELCEGQARELSDQYNSDRTVDSLLLAIKGKTAALFAASCVLGAGLADLSQADIESLDGYAESFGIAFQYMDDVADFTQSSLAAGKSVGNDIREGNYTLPVILSLQSTDGQRLKGLLKQDDASTAILEILQRDGTIDRTRQEAEAYKQRARLSLDKLTNGALAEALKASLDYF